MIYPSLFVTQSVSTEIKFSCNGLKFTGEKIFSSRIFLTKARKALVCGADDGNTVGGIVYFLFCTAGKKTRIMALLRQHFGSGIDRLKSEHKTYKVNDKTVCTWFLSH